MIDADIRGKLGRGASNAHERSEDLLTSTVFGLLRHFDLVAVWLPLMQRVRPVALDGDSVRVVSNLEAAKEWLNLNNAASCELEFWPSFGKRGEPDLVVSFRDALGHRIHLVVIEAKLHSPKSGEADEDSEEQDQTDAWEPDQLVRYWKGSEDFSDPSVGVPRTVVYLTAHATPPVDELRASLRACPDMRLGWASWHDIWRVISSIPQATAPNYAASDLVRLLEHRGFSDLHGFRRPGPDVPGCPNFWKPTKWFVRGQQPEIRLEKRFWRSQ